VCDLETSRMGAPYIYDISNLRVKVDSDPGVCNFTTKCNKEIYRDLAG